ncbi:MAG: hypothetical protein GY748_26455 [Planctomycetaceae bacterium]|nr:hypothetical protein [Planctomycetaceae bacterium]MCP4477685.1 hypothetical protein [Planctomycetaceae bacterium]
MRLINACGAIVFVWICIFQIGCGNGRPFDSVIVEGVVSYAGSPINNGEIRFYPKSGTKGPVSGAPIKNGNYVVTSKGGVPVGEHLVKIQAFEAGKVLDKSIPSEIAEDFAGDLEQLLPARFNTASVLSVTIKEGAARQQIDFDLEED